MAVLLATQLAAAPDRPDAVAGPDTLALDAPGGRAGFDLGEIGVVVDFTDEAVAFPVPLVRLAGAANEVVAGAPVAVVFDPADPQQWSVFSRRLDDTVVELARRQGRIIDRHSGSAFDPVRGIALDGPLQGQILDPLPGFTALPRDYFTFWPQGRIWG